MVTDPVQRAELAGRLLSAPSWDLLPNQQDDLELLLLGLLAPLEGYVSPAVARTVRDSGALPDGPAIPAALTLTTSADFCAKLTTGEFVCLRDAEGVPLALVQVEEISDTALSGRVFGLDLPTHYDHLTSRRTAVAVRAELTARRWAKPLAVAAERVLHQPDLDRISTAARECGADGVLIIGTMSTAEALDRSAHVRLRCLQLAADQLQATVPTLVTVIPRPSAELRLNAGGRLDRAIAGALGAAALLTDLADPSASASTTTSSPALVFAPAAEDRTPDVVAALAAGATPGQLTQLTPAPISAALAPAHPPRNQQGFTVFFTGFSGSGKSTVANALVVRLLERDEARSVLLLDGDVVRKHLSAGLTFSRADRDANVRRIGFVAAEVSRAGGIAVCAPIAPYDETRKAVRQMAGDAGGFILVHVDTPLEECERRDRKGLYARARAGLIPEFTGISDPYERPEDADVVIDTTQLSVNDSLDQVITHLVGEGWLGTPT